MNASTIQNTTRLLSSAWQHFAKGGASNAAGLVDMLDDTTARLGRQLRDAGRSLGQRPGPIGVGLAASFAASHSLDRFGRYLESAKFTGARDDVSQEIKRNPLAWIAAGAGLGFLVGGMLSTSLKKSASDSHS